MNKLVILWLFVFVSISVAPPPGPPPPGPSCEPIGGECNEEADCCGPAGNQGCEFDVNKDRDACCGRETVGCQGDADCCDGFECDQGECTDGAGNAVPFKWVERDPFMYIYILTWAVCVTFICSVPCAWCYLMDRYDLFQKKEKYGKVVDEHDDL
eukprot:1043172_1